MTMTNESQAIEVEVLEIDGAVPAVRAETQSEPQSQQPWRNWQGRVRQLDGRWWPLWVFLGAIAVVLLLTVGLVLGMVFLIFRIVSGILRAIFR